MSRHIDKEKLANPELLDDEERWYLWTRDPVKYNRLGLERPENPYAPIESEPAGTKVTPLEEQSQPSIGTQGGIIDDEEEDYEEGWNNDQRRAELSKRGLSIDGKKEDLIGRLRRSDADQLEDDDYSQVG